MTITPDDHAGIVAKYEELAAGHLRTIQDLKRVTAQLAYCRGQRDQAVTALLNDGGNSGTGPFALREHEQS